MWPELLHGYEMSYCIFLKGEESLYLSLSRVYHMFVCTEVDTTPGFYTVPGNHRSSCLSIKSFQARNHTCQNLGVWPSEAEQSLDRAIGRIRFLRRVDFGRRGYVRSDLFWSRKCSYSCDFAHSSLPVNID